MKRHHMRKILSTLLASTFLTFAPISAVADEAEVKTQVEEIASGLVERLPLDQKLVLKALSPERSGLPEDFLRKLTSDLEAALLVASDFEINLVNRLSTEELWSEAVEFGDADFEELYAASRADVMLMLAPRATGAGVEINITAYRLLGEDAGQVIASSGSVVLAIDMENNLGVDVNSLNDQMAQVLKEIEQIGQTGGLISGPNTYAEYYHNARVLQQRGETDLAISQYENVVKTGVDFVDPVLDLYELAVSRYGKDGAQLYFEKRINDHLSENLVSLVRILNDPDSFTDVYTNDDLHERKTFAPALAAWVKQSSSEVFATTRPKGDTGYKQDFYILEAVRALIFSYNTAAFQKHFIDDIRAATFIDLSALEALEKALNRFEVTPVLVKYQDSTDFFYNATPEACVISSNVPTPFAEKYTEEASIKHIPRVRDLINSICHSHRENYREDASAQIAQASEQDGAYPCFKDKWDANSGFIVNRLNRPEISEFLLERKEQLNIRGKHSPSDDLTDVDLLPPTYWYNFHGPAGDRLVFGKMCEDHLDGDKYEAIAGLLLTDYVDISKPIIVSFVDPYAESKGSVYRSNISVDGSYFSRLPAPIDSESTEGTGLIQHFENGWLFVPGLIQSSLGYQMIASISYTDRYGVAKTTHNAYINSDKEYLTGHRDVQRADFSIMDAGLSEGNFFDGRYRVEQRVVSGFVEFIDRAPKTESAHNLKHNRLVERIGVIFAAEPNSHRRIIQNALRVCNFYDGKVDGLWGPATVRAFHALFAVADDELSETYLRDFGLVVKDSNSLAQMSREQFVDFWNYFFAEESVIIRGGYCKT